MRLSIIIPVFNEEKTIAKLIARVMQLKIPRTDIEVLVVDDASKDGTKKELQRMNKIYKKLHVFSHKINQGKGSAVKTALQHAKGEYVVIQDADLEYNPQDIQKLVQALHDKKSVVYGTRLNRFPHITQEEKKTLFLLHFFGNRFLSLVTSMLYGQWITDMETCYKLFPAKAINYKAIAAKGFEFEPEITVKLMKKGYKITEVAITTIPRGYGEGKKLHTVRDGAKALWTLLRYKFVDET